jgi:putative phosphoesterase
MLLGILSDTHGHVARTQQAVERFASLGVDQVLHCGDIGSPAVVELLAPWPAHFVFGNVDDPTSLREAIRRAGQTCHERFGKLDFHGKTVAFLHGDDSRLLRETIERGRWSLVCYGHTHVAEISQRGDTLVVNPGALYRTSLPSVAVVRLPSLEVRSLTVSS